MHNARGHEGPTDNQGFPRMTAPNVQKTGVFEHPLHAALASFGQVSNNHVQQ